MTRTVLQTCLGRVSGPSPRDSGVGPLHKLSPGVRQRGVGGVAGGPSSLPTPVRLVQEPTHLQVSEGRSCPGPEWVTCLQGPSSGAVVCRTPTTPTPVRWDFPCRCGSGRPTGDISRVVTFGGLRGSSAADRSWGSSPTGETGGESLRTYFRLRYVGKPSSRVPRACETRSLRSGSGHDF